MRIQWCFCREVDVFVIIEVIGAVISLIAAFGFSDNTIIVLMTVLICHGIAAIWLIYSFLRRKPPPKFPNW